MQLCIIHAADAEQIKYKFNYFDCRVYSKLCCELDLLHFKRKPLHWLKLLIIYLLLIIKPLLYNK